jgi:uncharacterized DUF497 family protein
MQILWSEEKNDTLKQKFGFGFERIVIALSDENLWADRRHANQERYPHQRQLIVDIEGYAFIVPYVENEAGVFLKTFFPSKATRDYLKGEKL